ncbi:MAG: anti-sigma factor antagonist [Mycobacteriales bacterium]
MDLKCTVEQLADATIIHVVGEIDLVNAAKLREVLIDVLASTPSTHLVVDLAGVGFIDSTGIGVIVGAHKRLTASDGRLSVVVATSAVRKVLQTTGLLKAWRVTATVKDALDDV